MSNYITNDPAIKWTKINYQKRSSATALINEVKVLVNSNTKKPYGIAIARNLTDEAGWDIGTRVTLFKGSGMFKLAYDPVGLERITKPSETSKTYGINGMAIATQILAFSHGCTLFDAWVDGEDIIFKKKAVE